MSVTARPGRARRAKSGAACERKRKDLAAEGLYASLETSGDATAKAWDEMKDACGIVRSGVVDLATNPKHLKGLGRDSRKDPDEDLPFMTAALAAAKRAPRHGDVPVGAVVVKDGKVVVRTHNRREVDGDPAGHAELIALRKTARKLGSWRLDGCTLYVTLEPCAMCAGAIVLSRIPRLVFGTADPKAGFVGSRGDLCRDRRLNHRVDVTAGVMGEECGKILKDFFRERRARGKG